jgi:hypothetical protein
MGQPWETLRQRIADDKDLLRVVARTSPANIAQDQTCRILFAAMDFLGQKHEFEIPTDGLWNSFRRLRNSLLAHEEELTSLLQRPAQVNDPLRCVGLYAGFLFAARRTSLPLALVEVGPSLGLNLCMDRFAYEYIGAGKAGNPDSECILHCELEDLAALGRRSKAPSFQLPEIPPPVGARVGLELQPVSLDKDSLAWMRAFHFPQNKARFDNAVSVRRRTVVQIIEGDAADTIMAGLSLVPNGQVPLLFHTAVAYQMPETARERFSAKLAEAARQRRLMYMTWAEEPARRGAVLQVTDLDLANGIAERNLLAFATRWEPMPKLEWVSSPSPRGSRK